MNPSPPDPLRGANIGFDVVRRTIFAGPRPDILSRARERGSRALTPTLSQWERECLA